MTRWTGMWIHNKPMIRDDMIRHLASMYLVERHTLDCNVTEMCFPLSMVISLCAVKIRLEIHKHFRVYYL